MEPTEQLKKSKYFYLMTGVSLVFILLVVGLVAVGIRNKQASTTNSNTLNDNASKQSTEDNIQNVLSSDKTPKEVTLPKFSSCKAFNDSLKTNTSTGNSEDGNGSLSRAREMAPSSLSDSSSSAASGLSTQITNKDYSGTNVQVAGVDEADIVKTDGKHIYTYSQPKKHISIVEAIPPEKMSLISTIPYSSDTVSQIFLDEKKLIVFGTRYPQANYPQTVSPKQSESISPSKLPIGPNYSNLPDLDMDNKNNDGVRRLFPTTKPSTFQPQPPTLTSESFMDIWDVNDPKSPKRERSIGFEGKYSSSRLYDGVVYVTLNGTARYSAKINDDYSENAIPRFHDSSVDLGTLKRITSCDQIEYFDSTHNNRYFILAAIPTRNNGVINTRTILGYSETVYMSPQNIYIARQDSGSPEVRHIKDSNLPDGVIYDDSDLSQDTSNTPATIINKFSLLKGKIYYAGKTTVTGKLLNQFSMDEYKGNLRVATTLGYSANDWRNSLYILNQDLEQIGRLEKLAPGEKIYSARFMGDRAYLVTFKEIDPFFVLDLSNPRSPKVLGKLKIPGFSQYLHPFGNDRVIGVGKVANEQGRVGGVKLALFDVSHLENPREVDVIEIGGVGTTSEVLTDHKAFLFDAVKELLVLPISLKENYRASFQGAYVFRTTKNGFEYRSRLAHTMNKAQINNQNFAVRRSLYIGDVIYTVSGMKTFAHRLGDLVSLGSTDL